MGNYDNILEEIRQEHSKVIDGVNRFSQLAIIKVPLLCEELRKEEDQDGNKMNNDDIRDRVLKDCIQFWKKDTIQDSFPEWLVREKKPIEVSNTGEEYGVTIEEEDDTDKYKYDKTQECSLKIKRTIGTLLEEVTTKEDVEKIYNDAAYLEKTIKNIKTRIENKGREHKAVLTDPFNDTHKQLRKPISVYNLTFEASDEVKPMIEEMTEYALLIIKQFNVFINGINRYPIMSAKDADKMRKSLKSLLIEIFNSVNNKSSQSIYDQLATDAMGKDLTDKQAAKASKALTLACKTCVKKFDAEKNDEPPIMLPDKGSPSGFRCPICLKTERAERGLTKDIVEARRSFLEKMSSLQIEAPALQVFEIYAKLIKEPLTATKKILMSGMLKKSSAFGSTKEEFRRY